MEAYLVDDLKDIVVNSKGQDIHGSYVVFDIETTGFSPVVNKIIEIGAVRVETERLSISFPPSSIRKSRSRSGLRI